jgi:N-acetylglucosamine malate deacetylase 1
VSLDLLAIAPHPDDAEIGCGGTLIKAARAGKKVGILELTRGEMGTLGTPEIRDLEAQNAAQIIGLAYRGNLALPDGGLQNSLEQRLLVAQAIRNLRPQTVLLPHETDRHPDHVGAAQLCTAALHLAGLHKAQLESAAHKVRRVLYYQGNAPIEANVLVDVSGVIDTWAEAIMAHQSQFTGRAVSETVTPQILERRKARMMYWGTFVGVPYAEAFVSRVPMLLEVEC